MDSTTSPKQVTILLFAESSMMTLSSVLDPLRAANRLSRARLFNWRLISADGSRPKLTCGISIDVDEEMNSSESGDVLFIIAGFNHSKYINTSVLGKIRKAATRFKTVCSIEAGAWILARAGVLKNQSITTHWEDLENLAFAYPNLNVVNERFTIDKNLWSSGGASPTLDMLLYYLRATERPSLALDVANVFIYNEGPGAAEPQASMSLNWLDRIEPRLARAIRIMEQKIEEPIALPALAQAVGLSPRMLELISKRHLQLSPGRYYLRLRLQAARRLVLDSNLSILEISIRTGFSTASVFTRAFKARYHVGPKQLRLSLSGLSDSDPRQETVI